MKAGNPGAHQGGRINGRSAPSFNRTAGRRALRRREVSPLELIDAAEQRIRAVEPALNAIPTLCFARAREHAKRIMTARAVTVD